MSKTRFSYLQNNRRDETLDLGCLETLFLSFLLRERSLNNVLSDIIFLRQIEQLANFGGSLGSKTAGNIYIS